MAARFEPFASVHLLIFTVRRDYVQFTHFDIFIRLTTAHL